MSFLLVVALALAAVFGCGRNRETKAGPYDHSGKMLALRSTANKRPNQKIKGQQHVQRNYSATQRDCPGQVALVGSPVPARRDQPATFLPPIARY
ncbi:MAG: hypothetical protein IPP59_01615 [Betaproteobacteria bacterium]|nr:hypothetical protein [Candidatus Dechloromonas phosphorivorans]